MCFGKDVLVQGQKKPIDNGQKQDEVKARHDSGLLDPLFVMIGRVTCPLRRQADEGEREIGQRPIKLISQSKVQQQHCHELGQSKTPRFVSNPLCINAQNLRQQHVTFGECIIPKHQAALIKYSGHKKDNSWGKSSFHKSSLDISE